MSLTSGEVFAGYTILRLLGSGAMGEVYLAQHPRLPRREALKVLRNVSGGDDYARFVREADVGAALWHPNIVRVNDRGEFNGQLWISMDFVDGTDAASLLRDRYPVGMPADKVAAIIGAVAGALDYAHRHDLLHRDVSPANVLLTGPEDGDQRILLSDFGIARNIGDVSGLTATNMTIGTLPYAAPEQLADESVDGRADQYALAATAYHLLTGSPLFPHTNPAVVISRHLTAPPPTLAETRPKLRAFDSVLAVALAKDPADRFAECTDFARAFAQAAHSGGHPTASASTVQVPSARRSPESTANNRKRRRWRRIRLAAASTMIVLTAVGAIGYMIEKNSPAQPGATAAAVPPPALSPDRNGRALVPPPAPPSPPPAPVPASALKDAPVLPPASPAPVQAMAPKYAPAPPPASPARAPVPAPALKDAPVLPPASPAPVQAMAPKYAPAPPPASPARAPVPAVPQYAPPPAPAPQRPAPDPDQTFLNLASQIPGVTVIDPARATASGRALCTGLGDGESPADAAAATVRDNEGLTPAQASAAVNAAITAYCPQGAAR